MKVRNATLADLASVLEIYARARQFMKDTGNPEQWGSIYPPREVILSDISSKNLFLLVDGEEIHGVFAFFKDGDSVYDYIDGSWLNGFEHSAIHRVASAGKTHGVLGRIVEFCLSHSNNLKIDTHPDNLVMQHSLEKLGFVHCGTVTYPDAGERIAYQKFVEK